MALLNASANFKAKPKTPTIKIINELKKYDSPKDPTLSEDKLIIMQVLQNLYFNTIFEKNNAITVFDKNNGLNKINIKTIKKCLRFVKYIDLIDYWYITVEQNDGSYKTLIQCSKTNKQEVVKKNKNIEKKVKENKGHIDSGIGEYVTYGKKQFDVIAESFQINQKNKKR